MAGHDSPLPTTASFQEVNNCYDTYYAELRAKGSRTPHRETEKGIWISSVGSEVFDLFRTIGLQQFTHFADLGSGDGRVAIIASLFTKSTGIEFDEALVQISMQIKERLGARNLQFITGDFLEENLSVYDILFIYPDNPILRLEEKLLKEFRGELIVCGGIYPPERLVKNRVVQINNAVFGIYRRGRLRGVFAGRCGKT